MASSKALTLVRGLDYASGLLHTFSPNSNRDDSAVQTLDAAHKMQTYPLHAYSGSTTVKNHDFDLELGVLNPNEKQTVIVVPESNTPHHLDTLHEDLTFDAYLMPGHHAIRCMADPEFESNWISEDVVKRTGLSTNLLSTDEAVNFVTADGDILQSQYEVQVTWASGDKNQEQSVKFHVLSHLDVDMILGKNLAHQENVPSSSRDQPAKRLVRRVFKSKALGVSKASKVETDNIHRTVLEWCKEQTVLKEQTRLRYTKTSPKLNDAKLMATDASTVDFPTQTPASVQT